MQQKGGGLPEKFALWVEAERGRFVLLLPVAMGAAILLYFSLPTEPPLWLGGAAVLAASLALAVGWRWPVARFCAALALAASLGFFRAEMRTAGVAPFIVVPVGAVDLTGTVSAVELLPAGRRITLAHPSIDGSRALGRDVRLRLRADDATPLAVGAGIDVYGRLFGPERPAYPGGWDQGRQDFFANLGATGFAYTRLKILAPAKSGALAAWLDNLRGRIAARILTVLPIDTGTVAATLLTGDADSIPAAERSAFVASGLAHILAVAGLHVGIVMGLAFGAVRFGLTRFERVTLSLPVKPVAAVAALLAGGLYAALTGAHLPIMRSLAMAALVTLGVLYGRQAISLRGLGLAAMILMLSAPEDVVGVSFQMSFSAVLALIAGFAAVRAGKFHGLGGHVAGLAYTSLLAGGASMPFAAYQFQQIQPYWIPANLLAVPLTALWIMPCGLLALAFMPFGAAALALVPMGWGIAVMVWMTARIAAWPSAILRIPPMPDAAILLMAAGLIWLCIWRSAPRLAGIVLMMAGLCVYAAARPPDVLVAADAQLIAVRAGPGRVFLVTGAKENSYTLAQWAPVWGGASLTPVVCQASACVIGKVLFAATPPAACFAALVVVSPKMLGKLCGATVIDRLAVFENGATAAWIGDGVTIRTDRQMQGARPWVTPYPPASTLR
jgi:competence protein ComEC